MNWHVTKKDADLIRAIVRRAGRIVGGLSPRGAGFDALGAEMDITACHANGTPLDLVGLLAADDFNFAHDFGGIRQHIDRETGKLIDFFVPRFSVLRPSEKRRATMRAKWAAARASR